MAVTVLGGALQGVDAIPIQVEVDLLRRLPRVCVVGLAAAAVKESAERVRSAIVSAGIEFPRQRIVVNLAPADVRKEGTALDLPIALGILAADGLIPPEALDELVAVGELSLAGQLKPVRGALSLALLAREIDRTLLVPWENGAQAALVPGARVLAAHTLEEVVAHLRGEAELGSPPARLPMRTEAGVDLSEVRGQAPARRALEIAAAGAHHVLMVGPPGCGKSMLARRLPTILPDLAFEEALETTRVHSAARLLEGDPCLIGARPFRAPHHSVSPAGLVGGRDLQPGEVSLAHNGVLFLDEASEFQRSVLELLREPLEEGAIRITRGGGSVEHPAQLTLVMATNPCPCGRRGSPAPCICADSDVLRYRRKLSGPILDRIDLHVTLEPVSPHALFREGPGEPSAAVRERVVAARSRQARRRQPRPNGRLAPAEVEAFVQATDLARDRLQEAVAKHGLSGRAASRLLKVSRTIADLADAPRVDEVHVAEAMHYRPVEGL